MEITLTNRNQSFRSSVEHDGERVELRAGRPVELPAKAAKEVIAEAEEYGLEVVEGVPEPADDGDGDGEGGNGEGESGS